MLFIILVTNKDGLVGTYLSATNLKNTNSTIPISVKVITLIFIISSICKSKLHTFFSKNMVKNTIINKNIFVVISDSLSQLLLAVS